MKVSGIGSRGVGALALLRSAWKGRAKPQAAGGRRLEEKEREALLQAMRLGCPRSTAAKCVGMSGEQLQALLQADDELNREVLQAEAAAEVRHMNNVHKASSDEKNWRTSVWWLEQRGAIELGDAEIDLSYPEAVMTALDKFAQLIIAEIPDVMRRQLLLTKLLHIAAESVEAPVVIEGEVKVVEEASPQLVPPVPSP